MNVSWYAYTEECVCFEIDAICYAAPELQVFRNQKKYGLQRIDMTRKTELNDFLSYGFSKGTSSVDDDGVRDPENKLNPSAK